MSMPKETFNSTPPPPQHQLAWKLHVQDTQCSVSALIFAESHARFLEGLRLFALLLPALLGPDSVNDFFFLPFVRAPVVVADGRRINAAPAWARSFFDRSLFQREIARAAAVARGVLAGASARAASIAAASLHAAAASPGAAGLAVGLSFHAYGRAERRIVLPVDKIWAYRCYESEMDSFFLILPRSFLPLSENQTPEYSAWFDTSIEGDVSSSSNN